MKGTVNNFIPGSRIYEYLLILTPPEDLWKRIMRIKRSFYNKYKAESAIWAKPHITLAKFIQIEKNEERVINRLYQIAMGYSPIKIEFKDYGNFPYHTIYINIDDKMPVQHLVKLIQSEARYLMKSNIEHKPHFVFNPHLSVAHKLLVPQYETAWREYAHKHFVAHFIANNMLLLKRPAGELKYQIVQYFEFQNLPVATRQGDLFALTNYGL